MFIKESVAIDCILKITERLLMKVLITGGAGFLGANLAKYFSTKGHQVYGCGRGILTQFQQSAMGFSSWNSGPISNELLDQINCEPDLVIHCAGAGSVDVSLENPRIDYINSVQSTEIVLEHIRRRFPLAKFIFPSSPAVIGSAANHPIPVSMAPCPLSTYGHDKLIAETLCETYRHNYGLNIVIIRLFSVYGIGLRKQILWDACTKFSSGVTAEFWGDGNETRDFVNINDVADLFYLVASYKGNLLPKKLNCGGGTPFKVCDILEALRKNFEISGDILFNHKIHNGHPRHYWSDNAEAYQYGWKPRTILESGLHDYAEWFKTIK